jgi:hypothetical protein
MYEDQIKSRRVIEGFRTGVPTNRAIELTGSGQSILDNKFLTLMTNVRRGENIHESGFFYFGDFGTGKSHLISSFKSEALKNNFVVSSVSIGPSLTFAKEDGLPLLAEIVESLETKDYSENCLSSLLAELATNPPDLTSLLPWVRVRYSGESQKFFYSLTKQLQLVNYPSREFEWLHQFFTGGRLMLDFRTIFGGDWVNLPVKRQRLFETIDFLSELFKRLGKAGWIILLDEIELIRNYSYLQRSKTYDELSKWLTGEEGRGRSGVGVIGSFTAGFTNQVILDGFGSKNDAKNVPNWLKNSAHDSHRIQGARRGMYSIAKFEQDSDYVMKIPSKAEIMRIQEIIRNEYQNAYSVQVPTLTVIVSNGIQKSLRRLIREWITSWDLIRAKRVVDIEEHIVSQDLEYSDDGNDN